MPLHMHLIDKIVFLLMPDAFVFEVVYSTNYDISRSTEFGIRNVEKSY